MDQSRCAFQLILCSLASTPAESHFGGGFASILQMKMEAAPAGAVVLELLAYNWEWKGISEVYVNITQSVGDIHHFAWRAKHPRFSDYLDADEARYAYWTAEECSSR